jgi:hypothetical protein
LSDSGCPVRSTTTATGESGTPRRRPTTVSSGCPSTRMSSTRSSRSPRRAPARPIGPSYTLPTYTLSPTGTTSIPTPA